MTRWLLALTLAASSCGPTRPPAVPSAAQPFTVLVMPDIDDEDRFCVVIDQRLFAYPPDRIGVHCTTVGALRWWLGSAKAAH